MIANGILLAFKELKVSVPVVVRIRGTNEKEGQRIVRYTNQPLLNRSLIKICVDCRKWPASFRFR